MTARPSTPCGSCGADGQNVAVKRTPKLVADRQLAILRAADSSL